MSAHTPGPWVAREWPGRDHEGESIVQGWTITDSEGHRVPLCSGETSDLSEAEANAHLFAAAPDLLEALTMGAQLNTPDLLDWVADRLVTAYGESPYVDFVVALRERAQAARAAIAKAKQP